MEVEKKKVNFIFDLGNVLIYYTPDVYLKSLFSDDNLVDKLLNTIFKSPEWLDMDRGILTHEEATDIFCTRKPELQSEIRRVMKNYEKTFTPIQSSVELLPKLKESGHDLYYLSNMHKEIRDHLVKSFDFFNLFEGGVFSCDVNSIKPSPEIYRFLLNKYNLDPNDCLFFDDMEENVSAAVKEGIKGIHFTTAECVLPFMRN